MAAPIKTPGSKPRFQSSNRHYHRYREDNRGWDDWVDASTKPASRKRWIWIPVAIVLASGGLALLSYLRVL